MGRSYRASTRTASLVRARLNIRTQRAQGPGSGARRGGPRTIPASSGCRACPCTQRLFAEVEVSPAEGESDGGGRRNVLHVEDGEPLLVEPIHRARTVVAGT